MFLKFTKRSGLVREDLVVSTELITTIQKSNDLLRLGTTSTVPVGTNPDPLFNIEITSNVAGKPSNGTIQTVNIVQDNYEVVDKEAVFFIFIFMRDPILNKSQNNRTFNNAVILEFRQSEFNGIAADAESARDQYWDEITGLAGVDAKVIEINDLLPENRPSS